MQTTYSMDRKIVSPLQWRTQKIFMGGFYQWHMVT